jgi:hypothetical protein
MTVSFRSMNIMISHLSRIIHCASIGSSVAMLEMVMAEVVLEMEKAIANALPSIHSIALLRS